MTEIAKYQPGAPATLPEKMDYARALAESGMLPAQYRRQPANLLYALEYAGSLGLHPMAAITGVHVIEGKPSASSALISALVRRAGHKLRVTGNDQEAVAQIIRADDPDWKFESRWDLDRAKRAGLLGKKVWQQYPAAMLKARAITEVARDACEEALSGMHYTPEELGANVGEDGEPMDAEVQQLRRVQPGQTDPWSAPAPPARDFVTEAREASDADEVRRIWQEAKAAGLDEKALGHIAAVGKSLTAEPTPKPEPDADGVVEGEVVEDSPEETDAREAEAELRAFAAEAGIDDIDRDAEGALSMPLRMAPAEAIRGLLDQLRGQAA